MPPLCPFGSSKSCGGHAWPSVSTNVVSNSLRVDQLAWKDLIGGSSFRLGHHEMPEEVQEVSVQRGTQHAEETRWNDGNWKTLEENVYFLSTLVIWAKESFYIISVDPAEKLHPLEPHPAGCDPAGAQRPGQRESWEIRVWSYPTSCPKKTRLLSNVFKSNMDFLDTLGNIYCIKYCTPKKKSWIFTSHVLTGGVDCWFFWSLGIMWCFTPAMALRWSSWSYKMWSKDERDEIVAVDSTGSFDLSRVYDWKVAEKPIFDTKCNGIFAAGQGSELKDAFLNIFGWHFTRFNVFPNLPNPILSWVIIQDGFWKGLDFSSVCKIGDEHPGSAKTAATVLWDLFLSGEREFDNHFETSTIKSPKGLWEVKCLAAAKNRSALAAILYIQTYHCFGHVG